MPPKRKKYTVRLDLDEYDDLLWVSRRLRVPTMSAAFHIALARLVEAERKLAAESGDERPKTTAGNPPKQG